MKSDFSEPIKIRKQEPKDHPADAKNTPWENKMPSYDERTSCFVNVGTHYGVGHNQPIGHKEKTKDKVSALPYGRVNTMRVDEAI